MAVIDNNVVAVAAHERIEHRRLGPLPDHRHLTVAAVRHDQQRSRDRALLAESIFPTMYRDGVRTVSWLIDSSNLGSITLSRTVFPEADETYPPEDKPYASLFSDSDQTQHHRQRRSAGFAYRCDDDILLRRYEYRTPDPFRLDPAVHRQSVIRHTLTLGPHGNAMLMSVPATVAEEDEGMMSEVPDVPDVDTRPADVADAEYTASYFNRYNYADRGRGRLSMYWFARRYYAALVRRHATSPGGALLELGCGLGHLLSLLQDDFECLGIDVMSHSVEETRRNAPRAQAFEHSADDLSTFATGRFSVVVALHVVEHLLDPEQAIQEVRRILRPGGVVLFATPNPVYLMRRYKDSATDAIGKDPTHINVHTPEQWRHWTEQAGFEILCHFGDGLWDVPYLRHIPTPLQFAVFGLPAFAQVVSRSTMMPLDWGVNQVCIARASV